MQIAECYSTTAIPTWHLPIYKHFFADHQNRTFTSGKIYAVILLDFPQILDEIQVSRRPTFRRERAPLCHPNTSQDIFIATEEL